MKVSPICPKLLPDGKLPTPLNLSLNPALSLSGYFGTLTDQEHEQDDD